MEPRKLTKEDIDKVRDIEGFPISTDEDIIALSDAPYYTACPNPFIEEFIKENGTPYDEATDDYHREPFAADVSEGKYEPIYKLHPYHTKVPYKAIMQYILHYTNPGDLVFDGFCGTGMTAVAAQMCGTDDLIINGEIQARNTDIKWGKRHAIVNDLSPAATYIAHNYSTPITDMISFQKKAEKILSECRKECAWMYETNHSDDTLLFNQKGIINYVIWSDVFICPHCGSEIIFWDAAVDYDAGKIKDNFLCQHCGSSLKKADCAHAKYVEFDQGLNELHEFSKQVPVVINYSVGKKRYEKKPDDADMETFKRIDNLHIQYPYPTDHLPTGYNTEQPIRSHGISNVHHFYSKRNLITLACFYSKINMHDETGFALTKVAAHLTKQYRLTYMNGCWGAGGGPMSGALYIPSLVKELNMLSFIEDAVEAQYKRTYVGGENCVTTQSSTSLPQITNDTIDYIFIDPPFGQNIMYSELNFLWEAWLKVKTQNQNEAIINDVQQKGLPEYQALMTRCLNEFYRILKPGRWMTVEFHNSKNAVWNSIQESLQRAGFVIADIRTLDKKHKSFKQVTSNVTIKQDLIISCYKPQSVFQRVFSEKSGTEETAWAFVRQHLENIPVVVIKTDKIEVIAERQAYLLFDRMVAYHIMQGIPVPLDATDFYRGLDEKFLKRDNMYFRPDQVNEYDTARIKTDVENIQFSLFVTNEKTAISWLYQQLDEKMDGPQTYAEIQPKFMQEVKSVDRYEAMPELFVILEENFLQDEKGRWYIPDVTKEGDVAKLREKKLWKEFEGYMNSKGKLKSFRSEAIRVGFSRLWKDKNYQAIVDIAERLPESTIQEDPNLLMYYDISLGRV